MILNKAIKKYLSTKLKQKGFKVVESGRGGFHLRAVVGSEPELVLTEFIFCKLEKADITISGQYDTFNIIITKNGSGFKKGDFIPFVNAVPRGLGKIRTKDLSPDSLGFAGKEYSEAALYRELKLAVTKIKDASLQLFMGSLVEASYKNTQKVKTTGVSTQDINTVLKDFGELTGALWAIRHLYKDGHKVFFPDASNEPLIDYKILRKNKSFYAVSAKANLGAAPSATVAFKILQTGVIKPTAANKKYIDFITKIKNLSALDAIIQLNKDVGTPGFRELVRLGVDMSSPDNLEKFLRKNFNSWSDAEEFLKPFYTKTKKHIKEESAKRIYSSDQNMKMGIVLSPLGYHLITELKEHNKDYNNFLTELMNSQKVEQLYLKYTKDKIKYELKQFSDSNFMFWFDSNANKPHNKKISFKMSK